jgi:hypothetical protein
MGQALMADVQLRGKPDGIHFTPEGHLLVATRMPPPVMGAVR